MSKYIPQAAVQREYLAQLQRRAHGLKTGFYIRYPDPESGPFVIKASTPEHVKELYQKAAEIAKAREAAHGSSER